MVACRGSGVIVFSYFASTVLVLIWLTYTIQVTLQENREDADGVANPGRTSELIRVSPGRTTQLCMMRPEVFRTAQVCSCICKGVQGL